MQQMAFTGFTNTDSIKTALIEQFNNLINNQLPFTFTYPVRYNHCFARIILDWIFQDCWYHFLSRNRPAVAQLSAGQLQKAIVRMQIWIEQPQVLIADNKASLQFRKVYKAGFN